MIKFNVIINNNNWYDYIKKPNHYLDKKLKKLNLKTSEFKRNQIFCTLLLSGNKEIRYLNSKFRKKDKPTDILSFPFHKKKELNKKLKTKKEVYLGDIIININEINNEKLHKSFEKKFDRLWIHGLVHLLGYVHQKDKDFKKMVQVEKKFFKFVND